MTEYINKSILVTGGAGFIGSHIVDSYLAAGNQVIVVDNLSTGKRENIPGKVKFYQMDLKDKMIERIFSENSIDVINHHAAQMDVRRSVNDPIFDANVNVVGFLNLIEHAKKHGLKKIIFSSTGGAIYGEQINFPADETHPIQPLSPYGITKLATEKYLNYYKEVHGIDFVILRYANVFGPRQNPHGEAGVVAIFVEKFLKKEQPIINGTGKQTRDFVFVGDVVDANLKALNYSSSEIFNIGTGIETDILSIFNNLKLITKSNVSENFHPAKMGEQMRSVISNSKAEKLLGWKPKCSIQEGLELTVEYFKNIIFK
ncbi:MAG: NAD-dependent epimerase/dehydratase family protein [Bacteroidetes bacterium]|nr:NAD-dependent epimerase/dehydratase family protein [Bacteroidota bacterium]